jgi:CRP/FNR family transcriptional regulator, anaerobic regulatory protein
MSKIIIPENTTAAIECSLFSQFESKLVEEIERVCTRTTVPAGEELMRAGEYVRNIPIVVSGRIKILRPDDKGNEVFLYHLNSCDTCAMTLNSTLVRLKSEIRAVTEATTKLILIPAEYSDRWLIAYPSWKIFVFRAYQKRFDELLKTVDSVAFTKLDERIWKYLETKSNANRSKTLLITHQEIADEVGTAREVVTRLLKKLEQSDKITISRGKIEIK